MSTKAEITKAVRVAMKTSLLNHGKFVDVDHPLFVGLKLAAKREYMSRVQTFPSTVITLMNQGEGKTVWSTTAAYLNGCIDNVVRNGKVGA
jgi:hypothetical protein